MELIKQLENLGYRFVERLTYEYKKSDPPPEAETLLKELSAHKCEAILYIAERNNYPAHTHISEQYRTAITKGIQAGQNPFDLLLQAIKCISNMTSDSVFYTANHESIKAIYGLGLLDPAPLQMELDEVQERLKMLTRPELGTEPEDSKRRIQTAVEAHRERETHLLRLMEGKNEQQT